MSEVTVVLRMEESEAESLTQGGPCRVVVVDPETGAEGNDLPATVYRVGSLPDPAEEPPRPAKCPRCHSKAPNLHPAVQSEGEVSVCPDSWHDGDPTTEKARAALKRPCSHCGRGRAECRPPDNPFLSCCSPCSARDGNLHPAFRSGKGTAWLTGVARGGEGQGGRAVD